MAQSTATTAHGSGCSIVSVCFDKAIRIESIFITKYFTIRIHCYSLVTLLDESSSNTPRDVRQLLPHHIRYLPILDMDALVPHERIRFLPLFAGISPFDTNQDTQENHIHIGRSRLTFTTGHCVRHHIWFQKSS